MPRTSHTSPESLGLHRLGHAELANNGQRCGTCVFAEQRDKKIVCMSDYAFWQAIKPEWRACIHYLPRSTDDHAARLYKPEDK